MGGRQFTSELVTLDQHHPQEKRTPRVGETPGQGIGPCRVGCWGMLATVFLGQVQIRHGGGGALKNKGI